MAAQTGDIRIGVGGWTFEPWRETFYPRGLPQAKELAHLSRALTAIEINGTFYRTQTPATFAKWRDETPEGFVFTVKAPRYAVNRTDLTAGADSIARFVDSGLGELGPKLGPILWQFAPTKKFARDEIAGFLDLLPENAGGLRLRHALEARHESFRDPAFVDLARARGAAIVLAADGAYPQFADPTADFAYARIQIARDASLAQTAQEALRSGQTVLLVAGNGHVLRHLGVPTHWPASLVSKVVVAQVEHAPAAIKSGAQADAVVQTPALPPRDVCAELREQWRPAPPGKKVQKTDLLIRHEST